MRQMTWRAISVCPWIEAAAYHASMDKRRTTPYSLAATDYFDMVYSGGKRDDITVVVVHVA